MGKERTRKASPIQRKTDLARLFPDNRECPAILQMKDNFVKGRNTKRIFCGTGTDRIEAQAGKHIPRGELSRIVVAGQNGKDT